MRGYDYIHNMEGSIVVCYQVHHLTVYRENVSGEGVRTIPMFKY
jgi:hypothetical protein